MREVDFSRIMRGIFSGAGMPHYVAEQHIEKGRADLIVSHDSTYYICEWKLLDAGAKPGEALAQITSLN